MTTGTVRIGISGWRYPPWRGGFYPPKLPQRQELAFASRQLTSIEVNASFYGLQRPSSWLNWHDATPDGFVFSVKGPKEITHTRRLQDVRTPLADFFASGVLALRDKLGPVLWQFPPQLAFDAGRLAAFFALLPHDTEAAHALAKGHDARLGGFTWLEATPSRPLRHAVEVRHASFADPAFIALLRQHRIALVVADTAGRWPLLEDLSADFAYLRLHGDAQLYASRYGDAALDRWARRIDAWRHGRQVPDARLASAHPAPERARRDVFCYFDNTAEGHAPYDAGRLAARLGEPAALSSPASAAAPAS